MLMIFFLVTSYLEDIHCTCIDYLLVINLVVLYMYIKFAIFIIIVTGLSLRCEVGFIVLCFWARQLTLTAPLSTQEYKMGTGELLGQPDKILGVCNPQWTTCSITFRRSSNTPIFAALHVHALLTYLSPLYLMIC